MDTIYALASAPGKAGVSVIRVSGPGSHEACRDLIGGLPSVRQAAVKTVTGPDGAAIDRALVLVFAAPHSFTGEDIVEFHTHGSTAIIRALLAALSGMAGLRQAEAGEFTRRALENERLDLAQVEGLADLIEAETEAQRLQAYRVFSGALGERAEAWRSNLIRAASLIEATIDFADEEVPVDVLPEVTELVRKVSGELRAESRGSEISERIRDGFEVAIIGPPNIGKSTLLNALAGREAAITSDVAGTTRDVIEVRMDLKGLPVTFLDTAGLRDTQDKVESIGVARAIERANSADLRIFLTDDGTVYGGVETSDGDILTFGRADERPGGQGVSGLTGQGVSTLIDQVADELGQRAVGASTAIRERHRVAIDRAAAGLDQALMQLEFRPDQPEIAADEMRVSLRALDSLVGRVDVEDMLDEIFASFCIGK